MPRTVLAVADRIRRRARRGLRSAAGQGYRYDALGRRVRSDVGGAQRRYSLYARDGRLLWQRDEVAGTRSVNVYLAGSLVAEYRRPLSGTVASVGFLHTDALGSPIAKTDATGAVVETSEYEPYGLLLNRANDDRPGYTGHVMDSATGLTYMQQRYYDPGIGRFLSVDPITANANTGAMFNRYSYALDNPYRFIDPDGRQAKSGGSKQCGDQPCPEEPKPNEKPQRPEPPKGCGTTRNCYFSGGKWSWSPSGQIDWAKVGAATLRVANSARLGASGLTKFGIGGAAFATGVGSVPGGAVMAWGAWNLRSSAANYQQGIQLANEAQQGSRQYSLAEAARVIFVGGLLPFGTLADDPGEPRYDQVLIQKFQEAPHKFLLELGAISP